MAGELDLNYNTKNSDIYKNGTVEIGIDELVLNECNGNMRNLQKEWNENPATKMCPVFKEKSKGKTADTALLQVPVTISTLAKELGNLMEATCHFLEETGIKFEQADENSAQMIKQ